MTHPVSRIYDSTSAEIMAEKFHRDSTDSVGYAGIVYS